MFDPSRIFIRRFMNFPNRVELVYYLDPDNQSSMITHWYDDRDADDFDKRAERLDSEIRFFIKRLDEYINNPEKV